MQERKIELFTSFFPSRSKQLSKIFGFLAAVLAFINTEARKIESGSLAKPDSSISDDASRKNESKKFKKNDAAPTGLLEIGQKEITETLRGINLLIKKSPNSPQLPNLLLNRALASFSLARKRLLDAKALKMDPTSLRLLTVAAADCTKVIQTSTASQSLHARAYYIRGLSSVYADNNSKAVEDFSNSLKLDGQSPQAGWMGLQIAEQRFEDGDFKGAQEFYAKYYKKMDPQSSELARYKMAWTHINLKQFDQAEKVLLSIITRKAQDNFVKDAIKDLAFLLSTSADEDKILEVADNRFKDREDRFSFLSVVMTQFEVQNKMGLQSKILKRLLESAETPTQKLQILLSGLRSARREYASRDHYSAFVKVRDFLSSEKIESDREWSTVKEALDSESQYLMRSFLETYSAKVKTPEKFSKDKIGVGLKTLFAFYNKHFSDSKIHSEILLKWHYLCFETQDWTCVDQVSEKVLAEKSLKAEHLSVSVDQLLALEELNKQKKLSDEDILQTKFERFLVKYPKATQWGDVARRLASILMAAKEIEKAIGVYDQIFQQAASAESFAELQKVRLSHGKFDDIQADTRLDKEKMTPEILEIQRESALRLAIEARKSGSDAEYKKYLASYLKSQPTPEKAMIVRKDFISFLLGKGDDLGAVKELQKIPAKERCVSMFKKECLQIWKRLMLDSQYDSAEKLLELPQNVKSDFPILQFLLTQLSQKSTVDVRLYQLLGAAEKEYLLSLLVLFKPDLVINLSKSSAKKNSSFHPLLPLAIRMKQKEWALKESATNRKLLGPAFKFQSQPISQKLPVETKISRLQIPKGSVSPKALEKLSQQLIGGIESIRKDLQRDLQKKFLLQDKVRALAAAEVLENQMAQFIGAQAAPSGLNEVQLAQYQSGIAELASSYKDQGKEWRKVKDQLQIKLEAETQSAALQMLDERNFNSFPWNKLLENSDMKKLKALIQQEDIGASLVLIDLMKEEKVLEDENFKRIRTGILLSLIPTESMRVYLHQELRQLKADDLLEELVSKPSEQADDQPDKKSDEEAESEIDL